jgi:dimethylargininase
MLLALTRAVPPAINLCELTHLARAPIDYARAVEEHEQYESALRALGCVVERLPDAPGMPDSVFVEDTAVVLDGLAVIARPGAVSRRGEVASAIDVLRRHRPLGFIQSPGTLDGGDVLVVIDDRASSHAPLRSRGTVFVGDSPRTNAEGARQLSDLVAPFGLDVVRVPVTSCLHLKSAVTVLPSNGGDTRLLINRDWIDASFFDRFELIDVEPAEPAAANVLTIGGRVLCADEHPATRASLDARGFVTCSIPAGELAKAEGGLTCGALIFASFDSRPN